MSSTSDRTAKKYTNEKLIDDRIFSIGDIWLIRDKFIAIPTADRVGFRDIHPSRCVIVIDNNSQNNNKMFPIITVAPLSHRVDCTRIFDIPVFPKEDQVRVDSIIQMSLSQPVVKRDLFKKVGEISEDKKDEIILIHLLKVGIDPEDLEEPKESEESEEPENPKEAEETEDLE